jgi:hypothetical protein
MNRRIRNRTYGGVGGRRARALLLPDAGVKGRRPGNFNLSISRVPHSMRDNRGKLVLNEAEGNPVGDTTL